MDFISYEVAKIWNKDSKLMRFVIFRYKSADAYKNCQPIWGEIEKAVFEGAIKVQHIGALLKNTGQFNENFLNKYLKIGSLLRRHIF